MSNFVPEPNYTQTPNYFFDEMLAEIDTMSELKVTLAIIRQTFGWRKNEDQISLSQLEELTGMQRQQVVAGCKAALARGYVWREKRNGRNYFGLNVGGIKIIPPDDERGIKDIPQRGIKDIPTKETEKENYEAKASKRASPSLNEPTVIPLDKYTTDRMYDAWKIAGFPRWTGDEYGYHVARVKQILKEDNPSEEEMHRLPEFFIEYYTDWNPKADAVSTLREMRRRAAREEREKVRVSNVTPLRPLEPKRPEKRVIT